MNKNETFKTAVEFLEKIPGMKKPIAFGGDEKIWWLKFGLDIKHPLIWNVVQELGHILNYISTEARLPTVFYPVSPPPYMNGAPEDFLSWVIENTEDDFSPNQLIEWLEGRLPSPIEEEGAWKND